MYGVRGWEKDQTERIACFCLLSLDKYSAFPVLGPEHALVAGLKCIDALKCLSVKYF